MDFDFQWLLLGLPVAFVLGWLASRFDLKQWRREQHDSPAAYFKGLNLLLNEQQDKAIDAFIEAVQHDPDTSDLHFALGNLFRRRGEYDRAVRVHQHLLSRADLPAAERERAQHELAQDFLKAGLFDRAEEAFKQLEGSVFNTEVRLALLTLYERSRDWRSAVEMAQKLERSDSGTGSFASRIAHYWCELSGDARAKNQIEEAEDCLKRAREAAPHAARSLVVEGQWRAADQRPADALRIWDELQSVNAPAFNLVVQDYAKAALACGETEAALERLTALHQRGATSDLLVALGTLDPDPGRQAHRLAEQLKRHASLSSAHALLLIQEHATAEMAARPAPIGAHTASGPAGEPANSSNSPDEANGLANQQSNLEAIGKALAKAAAPLQRYRCAACGFEAAHYFWQCPGCQGWDTYPPRRLEDL